MPKLDKYRPDIDGLRAIAVLGVVLYHACPGALPGGYVGVDIFFVISGYLITQILYDKMQTRSFSLLDFYVRRIKRIAPAFFFVITVVLFAGFFIISPSAYLGLSQSAAFAVAAVPNIYFNLNTGGYFDSSTDQMPLLHTWSLGVEEQFYFVFPWILFLSTYVGLGRKGTIYFLILLGVLSFGFCVGKISSDPSDCFYLLPYRAWELLLGSLLAIWAPVVSKRGASNALGVVGAAMIAFPMMFYSKQTLFPGAAALAPCAGAALVIAAGQVREGMSRRFLSSQPLVKIGLISFSVYLWHWPIIAFMNYFSTIGVSDLGSVGRIMVALCSLPLGYLSWKFVECPFRKEATSRANVYLSFAAASSMVFTFSAFAYLTDGFGQIRSEGTKAAAVSVVDVSPRWKIDLGLSSPPLSARDANIYGDSTKTPRIAVWGDSHAYNLMDLLERQGTALGFSFRFYGRTASVPLVGIQVYGKERSEYNNEVLSIIEGDQNVDTVVMFARWSLPTRGFTGALGPAEKDKPVGPLMEKADGSMLSVGEADAAFEVAVQSTIGRLRAAHKRVVLIYPWPETGYNIPNWVSHELSVGRTPEIFPAATELVFFERQATVLRVFDNLSDRDVLKVKPHELLIVANGIRIVSNGECLYADDNHPHAWHGIEFISHLLEPVWEGKP